MSEKEKGKRGQVSTYKAKGERQRAKGLKPLSPQSFPLKGGGNWEDEASPT